MNSPLPSREPLPSIEPGLVAAYRLGEQRSSGRRAPAPHVSRPGLARDGATLCIALTAAVWLAGSGSGPALVGGAGLCVVALGLSGLRGRYAPPSLGDRFGLVDEAQAAVADVSLAAMATITMLAVGSPVTGAVSGATLVWPLAAILLAVTRVCSRVMASRVRPVARRGVLIVGAGHVGARLERHIRELPELGLEPVGFLDSDPVPRSELPSRVAPILGPVARLPEALRKTGATHVVVAFASGADRTLLGAVNTCHALGVEVCVVPRLFEAANARLDVRYVGGTPVVRFRKGSNAAALWAKGALDRIAAMAAIALFAPLLLAIATAVRVSSPGPVLIRQRRVGRDAVGFDMLKFRSMKVTPLRWEAPEDAEFCWDEPTGPGGIEGGDRRTRLGRLLRATSLDELPQLFNIARGEMSFVGPRPERPQYVELFADCIDRYPDRHRMKPGLTGWSQAHGLRGQTSMVRRVERDNWYIENWSLSLDLRILVKTVGAMRQGAA